MKRRQTYRITREEAVTMLVIVAATLALVALMLIIFFGMAKPAHAAKQGQVIAGILLRQGIREGQVRYGTVDASPVKKINLKQWPKGVNITSGAGRQIMIKGTPTILFDMEHHQVVQLTDLVVTIKGGKKYRVSHFHLGVFSGTDWQHWYDDGYVCGSPQATLEHCLDLWAIGL